MDQVPVGGEFMIVPRLVPSTGVNAVPASPHPGSDRGISRDR